MLRWQVITGSFLRELAWLLTLWLTQLRNMAAASPLALLRDSIRNNRPVELKDSNNQVVRSVADASVIVLGDVELPRNTQTNFKKSSSSEFYSLDTLIFLFLNSELDNSTYIRECRDKSIDNVAIIDRRRALDYLTGKVDSVPNVIEPSGGTWLMQCVAMNSSFQMSNFFRASVTCRETTCWRCGGKGKRGRRKASQDSSNCQRRR